MLLFISENSYSNFGFFCYLNQSLTIGRNCKEDKGPIGNNGWCHPCSVYVAPLRKLKSRYICCLVLLFIKKFFWGSGNHIHVGVFGVLNHRKTY